MQLTTDHINAMPKLTNKQKEALAFEVMGAVTNMLLLNDENNLWGDELRELAATEEGRQALAVQAAKWMTKLPGKIWDISLPRVWEMDV
jgi:hypothetical protein